MARRSEVNPAAIRRYAKRLFDLPPIEINQHNQLIDGWYRLEAHKLAGATTVRAVVTEVKNELHHLELFCMRTRATAWRTQTKTSSGTKTAGPHG